MDLDAVPAMPDFVTVQMAFRHSLRSALECLATIGVPNVRIQIKMAGPLGPEGAIISQVPEPGMPLHLGQFVTLSVAGFGVFHHLPAGMREWSESGMGTRQIVELFDDPLAKTRYELTEGARLFAIGPDDPASCKRWIELFGINAAIWPPKYHFGLATLLPHLHRIAGTEDGICTALHVVLQLPLDRISYEPGFLKIPAEDQLRPGISLHRLGVDTVIGSSIEQVAALVVTIGPLSFEHFKCFEDPLNQKLVASVLDLVMPCDRSYSVRWTVLDKTRSPKLGYRADNSCLGLNTYLGAVSKRPTGATDG